MIPDAPHSTKRLTRREAVVVVSRKRDDYHVVEKRQLKWDQVKETFKDVKTYLYFLLGFFANVPNGATSNCERETNMDTNRGRSCWFLVVLTPRQSVPLLSRASDSTHSTSPSSRFPTALSSR